MFDWITAFGIFTGIAATIATAANIIIDNMPAVHAKMIREEVEDKTFWKEPNNKLGPEWFYPNSCYLSLKLVNDGLGIARKISWQITKTIHKDGHIEIVTNVVSYIGKGAGVIVREHIELANTNCKATEFSYEVKIHYKPIFGIRPKKVCQKFDGYGELKQYKFNGKSFRNYYEQ